MKLPADLVAFLMQTEANSGLVWRKTALQEWAINAKRELGTNSLSFAVKGFPSAEGLQILGEHLDAADVSNINEAKIVLPHLKDHAELWLTNGKVEDAKAIRELAPKRPLFWNVGSKTEWEMAYNLSATLDLLVSLRINSTSLLPPQDPAHIQSRFGFDITALTSFPLEWRSKVRAIHCHHGGEKSANTTFRALLEEMLKLRVLFPQLEVINLGGGWAQTTPGLLTELTQMLPKDIGLIIEPGRWATESAGFAFARVQSIQRRDQRSFLEGELSPGAHMRWVRPQEWSLLPLGDGERRAVQDPVWWGSRTCWEDDALMLTQKPITAAVGDMIVWSRVAGYALSWNHSFNGIPAAPIFFI